jgi:hypothetical protein
MNLRTTALFLIFTGFAASTAWAGPLTERIPEGWYAEIDYHNKTYNDLELSSRKFKRNDLGLVFTGSSEKEHNDTVKFRWDEESYLFNLGWRNRWRSGQYFRSHAGIGPTTVELDASSNPRDQEGWLWQWALEISPWRPRSGYSLTLGGRYLQGDVDDHASSAPVRLDTEWEAWELRLLLAKEIESMSSDRTIQVYAGPQFQQLSAEYTEEHRGSNGTTIAAMELENESASMVSAVLGVSFSSEENPVFYRLEGFMGSGITAVSIGAGLQF